MAKTKNETTSKKSTGTKKIATKVAKAGDKKKISKRSGSKTVKKDASAKKRYFKLIDEKGKSSIGRYTGATPKQAASKAFTKAIKRAKDDGKKLPSKNKIFIRESTRGAKSHGKTYGYGASRNELDKPQKVKITVKETGERKKIIYRYKNDIKKIDVPEALKKKKADKTKAKKTKTGKSVASKSKAKKTTKATKATKTKKTGSKSNKKPASKTKKSGTKTSKK